MNPKYEELPTSQWTELEAAHHLNATFAMNCRQHPDLMEPYVILLGEADSQQHVSIMRRALRETLARRLDRPATKPETEAA